MLKDFFKKVEKWIKDEITIRLYPIKYKKIIKRIKNKKDKIRVIFLCSENSKWAYQNLYEQFAKSEHFEPLVLINMLETVHLGLDKTRNNLKENYNFFKSKGMNVEYAYKDNQYIDLKEFKPDIVFYEQPYDLPKIYMPKYVSNFALTCYHPYSFEGLFYSGLAYHEKFHKLLYKFYAMNDFHINLINSLTRKASYNCIPVGYSKLDVYFNNDKIDSGKIWKEAEKIKIIYAPHHSFEKDGLKLATFKENSKLILELAKKYKNTSWIFKPHPRFKFAVIKNNIMTEDEIENYYKEWEIIGKIHTEGNYFDIFKTSDLMITDSVSFLAEYLPTVKPLIRLVNHNSTPLTEFGEKITKGYYKTHNNKELKETFEKLIENKDEKKEQRIDMVKHVMDKNPACEKIFENISTNVAKGGGLNVYTFWEPKENIPEYIKLCMETWKKFLPDYKIHILDYSNLDKYLEKDYYDDILYKEFTLPKQADAIRCALLKKYGGIWLDTDTIITNYNAKDYFNIDSDFILLGDHIGIISANKNSYILDKWQKGIKTNLRWYKMLYKNKFLGRFLFRKKFKKLNYWNALGNSIIDKYLKNADKNDFYSIDKMKINALPELTYYKDLDISAETKYIDFYFKNNFEINLTDTSIIYLHNSWTPDNFKKMSREDFLQSNCTMSNLLKKILNN